MPGHVHAALMAEYAEVAKTNNKPWDEFEYYHNGAWKQMSRHPLFNERDEYRRKPRTININGFEVPEPLLVSPFGGEMIFIVTIFSNTGNAASDSLVSDCYWCNSKNQHFWLNSGVIHKTREAAELHAKALLSFTTTIKE